MVAICGNLRMLRQLKKFFRTSSSIKLVTRLLRKIIPAVHADLRRFYWVSQGCRKINDYMKSSGVVKLHLGSGTNHLPGWLNTDLQPATDRIIFVDASEPLAFDSQTVDYIFAEHMIEHIELDRAISLLEECYRILKPGGKIRISTPCLDHFIDLFNCRKPAQADYICWVIEKYYPNASSLHAAYAINNIFYGFGHKFIYDVDTLESMLIKAGFSNISTQSPGLSDDENFCNVEGHHNVIGDEFNRLETMVLEAARQ